MKFRKTAMVVSALAFVLLAGSPAFAFALYAGGFNNNHLYEIDSDTWAATDLGAVTVTATSTHPNLLSMDFSPNGDLFLMRGRGNISGRPASIFSMDLDTMIATQITSVFATGIGTGTATDSGMTFRDDGYCYVLKNAISQRPIVMTQDFSVMTGPAVQTYTQGSNPTYVGMEWHDDGSADGQVYALNTGALGYMVLNTLNFPSAAGYAGGFFSTLGTLPSGYTTSGDLCVIEDMLYIMVANASASKLYSYDLSFGPNGAFNFLADYNVRFSALAGYPEPPAEVIPEPMTLSLLGLGISGIAGIKRLRRRK